MRQWTLEQKQKQKEAIQRWKPWEKSTGAKTPEGKLKSSKNATKTGDSKEVREYIKMMNRLLREQKNLIGGEHERFFGKIVQSIYHN